MEKAKIQAVTTAIILETRKQRKDGLYPVKLRVTFKRDRRYYNMRDELGESIVISEDDFLKVMKENPREVHKKLSIHLHELESLAHKIIAAIPVFSFPEFEKSYFEKPSSDQDLFHGLNKYAEGLKKDGRISTGMSFTSTAVSLESFSGKKFIPYENITVQFLRKYEKWMIEKGNSLTTVGIYLRNVRTTYRKAIKAGLIPETAYPFGSAKDDKYDIPTGRNIKKALSQKEVGLIARYKAISGSSEHRYRDYWMFSYLCNGINVKDMARLTYGNIEGGVIVINRAKTEREHRHAPRPITIVLTELVLNIINKWGNKPGSADQYIFPIISKGLTPTQEYKKIQQATKMINRYAGRIAKQVGITQTVTSYTARHSFATVLKRSGASTEFIGESLGHSSMPTTENYLADFEFEEKKKWADKLTDF